MRPVKLLLILLGLMAFAGTVRAESDQFYFKFQVNSHEELAKLTRQISIDNVQNNTVFAYATAAQFEKFKTLGYEYEILPNPGSLITPRMSDNPGVLLDWDTYPTYEAYVEMMSHYASDYPELCEVRSIGTTVQGRELLFAKLSDNVTLEEDEPEVMYSSSMHGDETTGYVLMLRLIDYLLSNYGIDPQVTDILDNMEVWINPLANPDGTYHSGNNTVNGAIRYNANGVDLNRNFPDPQDGQHPDGHQWQPETNAMIAFFHGHTFTISANFHGGEEVVNYPWDTWPRLHADNDWYVSICREYADSAQANSPSGYMTDLNNGITNGYAWYEVNGGRQDYLNYWCGDRETTIELSHTKLLPPGQLPAYWDYNRAAFITYIEQALYGIKGMVTDAQTGQPVAATISVLGHDMDSSEVYTDPDMGDYHRMIEAGTYDLRFTALGYVPQTVNNVVATYRHVVTVEVQLQPLPDEPLLSLYGNDAGDPDPGDTVSMHITLVNNGGGDAEEVNAALSSEDGYIDILQADSDFPMIPSLGGTATSNDAYVFVVSPGCPSYHEVTFRLDITASGGYSDSAFFSIDIGLLIEDFESGDFSNFDWQMSGNGPWHIVSSNQYEGDYAARSASITHNQASTMSIVYDVSAAGSLSFHYRVSSESGYDFLEFYIDDILQDEWSGDIDWSEVSYDIEPGEHVFKWSYTKDRNVSHGSDCAWLDYIVFPPALQTAIGDGESALPQEYKLCGNYPNPFNPSTNIVFALPKADHVELQVFDLLGRKVAILIDRDMPAGEHSVTFDGSDLSSGIYLYKLQAGTYKSTQKMVLLK